MAADVVKIKLQPVKDALVGFDKSLGQRRELYSAIAAGQLVSVRRTFREQGSPAGSWAPLSARTLENAKSKATAGRKIMILSGRLLNSIEARPSDNGVVVGTNVIYARVQQLGSADRTGAAIGPQAKIAGRSVRVGRHTSTFQRAMYYGTREVMIDGKVHHLPVAMRTGKREITDKSGRKTTVRAAYQGPRRQAQQVEVAEHERHQNIPPRPFLVFRPEDPARIRGQVAAFVTRTIEKAGLQPQGGA